MKVAVIGAGWAGCAAAVEAVRLGHQVTIFDSARTAGGRARRVDVAWNGRPLALDNGQHILIGAYSATLQLMRDLGVDPDAALLRLPLTLQTPDGRGLRLPGWPAPLDAVAGILGARGWTWADRWSLVRVATRWQLAGFRCDAQLSVASLCRGLSPAAMQGLIEPLCVSALNTPADRASGQVFLRVMRDAMFSASGGSNLLLPRVDLGALLPDAALAFALAQGGAVHLGERVQSVTRRDGRWLVQGAGHAGVDASSGAGSGTEVTAAAGAGVDAGFDAVLLACPPQEAARLVLAADVDARSGQAAADWARRAQRLQHEALTTVYVHAPGVRLRLPMLALEASPGEPAQFVFDRGQLNGPEGLLAFVISASVGDGAELTRKVLAQAARQLGLDAAASGHAGSSGLAAVRTIVEKRATFACTPGLERPAARIAHRLLACGDYIEGPYPATLEGAVRSGLEAARQLA